MKTLQQNKNKKLKIWQNSIIKLKQNKTFYRLKKKVRKYWAKNCNKIIYNKNKSNKFNTESWK